MIAGVMTPLQTLVILSISAAVSLAAPEKVLFGQPSSASVAEDTAKQNSSRKARVFAFPGSHQSSRTRTSYVVASPSNTGNAYEVSGNEYDPTEDQDERRLMSLLPTFGDNGMQVGLDFKLPFFNIPYSKIFSGLAGPIVGGGASNIFGGGSSNIFGGSPFSSSGSGSSASSALSNIFSGSDNSLLSSSMATVAAMAVTAALLYPKVTGIFSPTSGKSMLKDGNGADDFFQNVNSVLKQFNIDGESCMKVALCSVSSAKKRYHTEGRGAKSGTTSAADLVEDILNLPVVKKNLNSVTLVQARDFGGSGGDCDYFNNEKKCPFSSNSLQKMLSSFG